MASRSKVASGDTGTDSEAVDLDDAARLCEATEAAAERKEFDGGTYSSFLPPPTESANGGAEDDDGDGDDDGGDECESSFAAVIEHLLPLTTSSRKRSRKVGLYAALQVLMLFGQILALISITANLVIVRCQSDDDCPAGSLCLLGTRDHTTNGKCVDCGENFNPTNATTGHVCWGPRAVEAFCKTRPAMFPSEFWWKGDLNNYREWIDSGRTSHLRTNWNDENGDPVGQPCTTCPKFGLAPFCAHATFCYAYAGTNMIQFTVADFITFCGIAFLLCCACIVEDNEAEKCLKVIRFRAKQRYTVARSACERVKIALVAIFLVLLQLLRRFCLVPHVFVAARTLLATGDNDAVNVVMNALAVTFILEVDNLVYGLFISSRMKARLQRRFLLLRRLDRTYGGGGDDDKAPGCVSGHSLAFTASFIFVVMNALIFSLMWVWQPGCAYPTIGNYALGNVSLARFVRWLTSACGVTWGTIFGLRAVADLLCRRRDRVRSGASLGFLAAIAEVAVGLALLHGALEVVLALQDTRLGGYGDGS